MINSNKCPYCKSVITTVHTEDITTHTKTGVRLHFSKLHSDPCFGFGSRLTQALK